MNINEILDLDAPQIKVDVRTKSGNGASRTLLRVDIDKSNPHAHLNQIIKKISDKFIDSETTLKVIDTNPLIFNLIPRNGIDLFQFTVSITPELEHLQKAFMTARGIPVDRP
ncbi:hypothetical protein Xoosp13_207 [Xanthomonas phage Xoo-sp13]|nr:hypothetical protein Xoosp13_207 [Xanthomonas phage Xoo-sp13]